ncbi:MAG: hypothetical protein FVQ80_02375 [Planctomycetes bacterium]|nr:hypothetical protein [Planctomycetota bacterium]
MEEEIRQECAERELQKKIDEMYASQIKLASAIYDKANAYTNLVIMAGYAGFFGLWTITKDNLTPKQVLLSALFLLISGICFVLFETVKMIVNASFMLSKNCALKKLSNVESVDDFLNVMDEHDKTIQSRNVKFTWFWIFSLIFIVPTGLIGVSILVYSFIVNLLV